MINCSPPNTVIGIETGHVSLHSFHSVVHCSPPNTVIGIETALARYERRVAAHIAALLIPSSVLKRSWLWRQLRHRRHCSPPNTVIGIETPRWHEHPVLPGYIAALLIPSSVLKPDVVCNASPAAPYIAALLIPSSVLKLSGQMLLDLEEAIAALLIPSSVLKQLKEKSKECLIRHCSPPNTVIGIETIEPPSILRAVRRLQPS